MFSGGKERGREDNAGGGGLGETGKIMSSDQVSVSRYPSGETLGDLKAWL